YDLTEVQSGNYSGDVDPKASAVVASAPTVQNIRLVDPAVVSRTFQRLQTTRGFYRFVDTLDVDRYRLPDADGHSADREAVVAVRELDLSGLPSGSHNFANDHTVYTHGYGFVAAY